MYFSLSSIAMIAAATVSILWFLLGRRENQRIPTATVTNNDNSSSTLLASNSSSSTYEVFLSFCGKDTRKGFTDFLYTYLEGASIQTFRDDNELRVGRNIGSELLKAIHESKISIPIFSENYASSKRCLLELAQIVECHKNGGQMIYPIFYDVDPSDVRNQRGKYRKSFREHEKKFDEETVQSWRDALRMVGGLKGLELTKETGGHEGKLVKIVVEKVLSELKKYNSHVPENLVGMDKHVENLKGLLNVDSGGVRIVGIHGMGGLGKTTIAKVTYNQLYERFESHCFLDNVREKSKGRDGIVDLQNQLISKIQNRGVPVFSDVDEGRSRIKDMVRGRKVLMVLDDVDENFQVAMLMGDQSWFGEQSRIIITTRDKNVLDVVEMTCHMEDLHDVYMSYKPEYMGVLDSLQLFSKYAFMRDSPIEGYQHLSEEVVSIAAGLPLVLVVLGSMFFVVKGEDLWEEKLRQLRAIPHREVLETLRISFESLEYEKKQMFLDIACLFIGCDVTLASYMWDDCRFYPKEGINVLVSRSLITIGDHNEIIMHDQLRDLGRQIVCEEGLNELGKRSRLWHEEEAMHILETCQGTGNVNALCLPFEESEDPVLSPSFHDLPNLRYLRMNGQDLDGDFKHLLSSLRLLQWTCSGNFTPTNLHMKNLVILDLSWSKFKQGWENWSQFKIGKKLKLLDLTWCSGVTVLPDLSKYASLEILKFKHTSACTLDGLEQLKSLKHLDASNCYHLVTLPSLSTLTNLVELHLGSCKNLVEIRGLEKLKSLQFLDISVCSSLERLSNFSNLKKLKTFNAASCRKLIEIEGLQGLDTLEYLNLSYCYKLDDVLDLSNLYNLKELFVTLLEIADFSNFKKLKELEISLSDNLVEFQGLDGLESLEDLKIIGGSVKRLPNLSCLTLLGTIRISVCDQLTEIQDLGTLESLEHLHISYCSSIERLPNLSNLRKLKKLFILGCPKLIEIQGLNILESLKILSISFCPSLERLPKLPNFGRLKDIEVEFCDKLDDVEGLGVIESLDRLSIKSCPKLSEIPDLRRLKNLKQLKIFSLKDLTSINGLDELKYLESLDVSGCKSIAALPDFSNLKKLRELDISGCVKLTEILGLEELKSLKKLTVNRCLGLVNLPDLPNTTIERDPTINVFQ